MIYTINIGKNLALWDLENSEKGSFLKNPNYGQQIRVIPFEIGGNVVNPCISETHEGLLVKDNVNNDVILSGYELVQNGVKTNGLTLNPSLGSADEDEPDGSDIVILTYNAPYKFIRCSLGDNCEIINTFGNKSKDHGCIIRVPSNFEGIVLRSEAAIPVKDKKGNDSENYYHLNLIKNQDDCKFIASQNIIRKKETVAFLSELSKGIKHVGFRVQSKRLLSQFVLCREEDCDTVSEFVDNCVNNYAVLKHGYQIVQVCDDVINDGDIVNSEALTNLYNIFKERHVRAAMVWNIHKFPKELISKLGLRYIFTNGKNGSIKTIRSN